MLLDQDNDPFLEVCLGSEHYFITVWNEIGFVA